MLFSNSLLGGHLVQVYPSSMSSLKSNEKVAIAIRKINVNSFNWDTKSYNFIDRAFKFHIFGINSSILWESVSLRKTLNCNFIFMNNKYLLTFIWSLRMSCSVSCIYGACPHSGTAFWQTGCGHCTLALLSAGDGYQSHRVVLLKHSEYLPSLFISRLLQVLSSFMYQIYNVSITQVIYPSTQNLIKQYKLQEYSYRVHIT